MVDPVGVCLELHWIMPGLGKGLGLLGLMLTKV